MKKTDFQEFLSDNSLFDLERSKGAECIKFIPARIDGYKSDIKNYANQISIFEDMIYDKSRRLDKLNAKKGLKLLFNFKQINEDKNALIESIAKLRGNIDNLKYLIKMFDDLIVEQNERLNAIKNEIISAGLTFEEIEVEYNRLHAYFEAKERGEVVELIDDDKNDRIEQNRKGGSRRSSLDRFNARMQKHNELTKKKEEDQPGNN